MIKLPAKETAFFAIVAAVITWGYYGQFLDNFFTFDDFGLIEHIIKGPKSVLLGYNYILRFVANIVWWPLYYFSGYDPTGYNIFSIGLHYINALIFYFFVARLTGNKVLAVFSATVFVASAVGADAILWRAANATPLNVLFYLLTLISYVTFRQRGERKYYFLSIFMFLLATLSKEEAASLPLVVVLLEIIYFKGVQNFRSVIKRIVPYCTIIIAYVLMNYIVIYKILQGTSELVNLSSFRPLHSLFSGWAAFFIGPDGHLHLNNPMIYAAAVLVPMSCFLVKDKKLLLFGFGWVFLAFLPQSLSNLTQYETKHIFSSISRHLYLPSLGAALVYGSLLTALRERFSGRIQLFGCVLFFSFFIWLNHANIVSRGEYWRDEGAPIRQFLQGLKQIVPVFPPNIYIYVIKPPVGRAYVQQSLRAFYKNPGITWIVDPQTFIQPPGSWAVLLNCKWQGSYLVDIEILPYDLKTLLRLDAESGH